MNRILSILLIGSISMTCTSINQESPDPFQSILDSVYSEFPNTKGISMHIESPEHGISWSGSVGWADSASNRKLKPTDPAVIASITKTYMAAAILRLVEINQIALDQPIQEFLDPQIDSLFQSDGYATHEITIAHLCSHTSGFNDYVNTPILQKRSREFPSYHWTRDEQLHLTVEELDPVGKPGELFAYSDLNHLLLGLILEKVTNKPFYTAVRDLLRYEQLNLLNTWHLEFEEKPSHLSKLVHQFGTELEVDSYTLNSSFDLYGGGGIASTPKDVAQFFQVLFTGVVFDYPETSKLLYHTIKTADGKDNAYYMSVARMELGEFTCYGHGGFWGTTAQYFPELNCTISVFLMERDEWPQYKIILEEVAKKLKTHEFIMRRN